MNEMSEETVGFRFNESARQLAHARRGERGLEQWQKSEEHLALNQNEAPDPPSPAVIDAIEREAHYLNRYPDHRATSLRALLAGMLGVDEERIIFGNGSYEIIAMLGQVAFEPGRVVAIPTPTYGRYRENAVIANANTLPVPLREDGANDPAGMIAAAAYADIVVLCTPNNPTGAALTREEFHAIRAAVRPGCLLVVDEAYGDFSRMSGGLDALQELRTARQSWLVIRTLSKSQGLAGLRVGYGIASDPGIIEVMEGVRGLYNVGRLAQAAAVAALKDEKHQQGIIDRTVAQRERLAQSLSAMGMRVMPSETNFLCVRTGLEGTTVQRRLRALGVLVSVIAEPGYADCIRISIGTEAEMLRFLQTLTTCLDTTLSPRKGSLMA